MAKKKEPTNRVDTATVPVEGTGQTPNERDIDQRMADLLKDHQKMGARPK